MTTKELCLRARLTPREVQWWCETNTVRCEYISHMRDFDEQQALIVAIVAELRRKGLPLRRIRDLRLKYPKGDYLVVLKDHGAALWREEPDVIRCVAKAPGPCAVVSLKDLRAMLWPTPETFESRPSQAATQTI